MQLMLEVLGFSFALVVAGIGGVKYINTRLESVRKESKDDTVNLRREIKADTEDLHTRVNEVHKDYVRNDHLETTLTSLKSQNDHIAKSQDQLTTRMDALLLALTKDK